VRLDEVAIGQNGALVLTISRVEFYDFLSTNYSLESPEIQEATRALGSLESYLDVLACESLANAAAVSVLLADSEGRIGLSRRSRHVHVSSGLYGTTAAGSVDWNDFNEPDPFGACARRELSEELNLQIPHLHFEGIVISRQKLQPVFMYSGVLDRSWEQCAADIAEAADFAAETEELVAVRLEDCRRFLAQNDVTDVTAYQVWKLVSQSGRSLGRRAGTQPSPRR
jgi:8-oxo-dGTP pyrophosphatase MutT (NUDIX family)